MMYLAGFIALYLIYKLNRIGDRDRKKVMEVIEGIPATTDDIDEVLCRLDEIEEMIKHKL